MQEAERAAQDLTSLRAEAEAARKAAAAADARVAELAAKLSTWESKGQELDAKVKVWKGAGWRKAWEWRGQGVGRRAVQAGEQE